MNWMGGARNRVKAASDKKKQKEFFEKQRKKLAASNSNGSSTVSALSHDLITFYLKQRNLKQGSVPSKPTKVIKQNLEKRSEKRSCWRNDLVLGATLPLPETPLEDDAVLRSKILNSSWEACKSKNISATGIEVCSDSNGQLSPNQTRPYAKTLDAGNDIKNVYDVEKFANEFCEKYSSENSDTLSNRPESWESFVVNSDVPFGKVGEPMRGEKVNDDFGSSSNYFAEFEPNKRDKNAFFDAFLHKTLKEMNTEKLMKNKNSKHQSRSKKRMKILDKINSYISNHEKKKKGLNAVLHKSKLSYSKISQCTVDSMPLKVSRVVEPPSRAKSTFDYRRSLDDLEAMLENCDLKLKKRKSSHICPNFWSDQQEEKHKEAPTSSNVQFSSTDSTSSSSSPSTTYSYPSIDPMKITKDMPSYEMFQASLKQSESIKLKNGMLSHRRKIKLSNTHLQDSFVPDFQMKFAPYKFEYIDRDKSENMQKPSSLLSYFPTPKHLKSRDKQSCCPDSLSLLPKRKNGCVSFRNSPLRSTCELENLSSKSLISPNELNNCPTPLDIFPQQANENVSILNHSSRNIKESSNLLTKASKSRDQCNNSPAPSDIFPKSTYKDIMFRNPPTKNNDESSNPPLNDLRSQDEQNSRDPPSLDLFPKRINEAINVQNPPTDESSVFSLKAGANPNGSHATENTINKHSFVDAIFKTPFSRSIDQSTEIPFKTMRRQEQQNSDHIPSQMLKTPNAEHQTNRGLNELLCSSPQVLSSQNGQKLNFISSENVSDTTNLNISFQKSPIQGTSQLSTTCSNDMGSPSKEDTVGYPRDLETFSINTEESLGKYTSTSTQTRVEKIDALTETTDLNCCSTCGVPKMNSATSPFLNFGSVKNNDERIVDCFGKSGVREKCEISSASENIPDSDSIGECKKKEKYLVLPENDPNNLESNCPPVIENHQLEIIGSKISEGEKESFKINKDLSATINNSAMNEESDSSFALSEKKMIDQNHIKNSVIISNEISMLREGLNNLTTEGFIYSPLTKPNSLRPVTPDGLPPTESNSLILMEPNSLPPTEPNSPVMVVSRNSEDFSSGNVEIFNSEDPLLPTVPNSPVLKSMNNTDTNKALKNVLLDVSKTWENKMFMRPENGESPEYLKGFDTVKNSCHSDDSEGSSEATGMGYRKMPGNFVGSEGSVSADQPSSNTEVLPFPNYFQDSTMPNCRKISCHSKENVTEYSAENDLCYLSVNSHAVNSGNHCISPQETDYRKLSCDFKSNGREHLEENTSHGTTTKSDILLPISSANTDAVYGKVYTNSMVNGKEYYEKQSENVSVGELIDVNVPPLASSHCAAETNKNTEKDISVECQTENNSTGNNANISTEEITSSDADTPRNSLNLPREPRIENELNGFVESDFRLKTHQNLKKKHRIHMSSTNVDRFFKSMEVSDIRKNFVDEDMYLNAIEKCYASSDGNSPHTDALHSTSCPVSAERSETQYGNEQFKEPDEYNRNFRKNFLENNKADLKTDNCPLLFQNSSESGERSGLEIGNEQFTEPKQCHQNTHKVSSELDVCISTNNTTKTDALLITVRSIKQTSTENGNKQVAKLDQCPQNLQKTFMESNLNSFMDHSRKFAPPFSKKIKGLKTKYEKYQK